MDAKLISFNANYGDYYLTYITREDRPLKELFDLLKSGNDEYVNENYELIPPAMSEVILFFIDTLTI